MFDIIDYHTAERIKPLLTLTLEALSKVMENPEEFLANGYWTNPTEFPIQEKTEHYQVLSASLSDKDKEFLFAWTKKWLNNRGWDLSADHERIIPHTPATTEKNQ